MTTSDAPRPGRLTPRQAAQFLAERDPVLARLRAEAGPPVFPKPTDTHFATLVRSVTFQQLAGAAARAIHGRLVAALDGDVTPERLLATPTELLRGAGLSARKAATLQDLATKVLDGTIVLDSSSLARESDEEIVARLSTVRGIGKWSAEIFLMFQLRRMDVWPTWLNGELANDMSTQDGNIAMVFQHGALYPHRSVRRNIAFPLEVAGTLDKPAMGSQGP